MVLPATKNENVVNSHVPLDLAFSLLVFPIDCLLISQFSSVEQVSPNEGVESIMVPYDEARPPLGDIQVRKVALRFLREQVLPIVDERGACIGVVFAEDCSEVLCCLPSLPFLGIQLFTNVSIIAFKGTR